MENDSKTPTLVEKEKISELKFPSQEILKTKEEIANRKNQLERATSIGNMDHSKIKILFADNEGVKQTETTIWATTDKSIVLKKGTTIPINRIVEVKIY